MKVLSFLLLAIIGLLFLIPSVNAQGYTSIDGPTILFIKSTEVDYSLTGSKEVIRLSKVPIKDYRSSVGLYRADAAQIIEGKAYYTKTVYAVPWRSTKVNFIYV